MLYFAKRQVLKNLTSLMKGLVDILERLGMKYKNPILKYNQVFS